MRGGGIGSTVVVAAQQWEGDVGTSAAGDGLPENNAPDVIPITPGALAGGGATVS